MSSLIGDIKDSREANRLKQYLKHSRGSTDDENTKDISEVLMTIVILKAVKMSYILW